MNLARPSAAELHAAFHLVQVHASVRRLPDRCCHPRTRVTEAEFDRQVLAIFDKMRIDDQIAETTINRKQTEMRDRLAPIKLQADVLDRTRDENAELASRVFELSQTLRQKWLTADYAETRKILEIAWLNFQLNDASLRPTIRKPFDVLVEGLVSKESGGGGN